MRLKAFPFQIFAMIATCLILSSSPKLLFASEDSKDSSNTTLLLIYSTLIAAAIYYAPVVGPLLVTNFVKDDDFVFNHEGGLETEAKLGYGLFPDPLHFHAQASPDASLTLFNRWVGLNVLSRPQISNQRVELTFAPLRGRAQRAETEIRGLLLLGRDQVGDREAETVYGYQLFHITPNYKFQVAARGFATSKDAIFELQMGRFIWDRTEVYLHAENRVGFKSVETKKKDNGRNQQHQYESVRLSLGFSYSIESFSR